MDHPFSPKLPRGIYLLPNLLTLGGLFAGFYAIIAATNHHFAEAAISVFIAMIFDGLDGRVARLTNTESSFGVQFDSLSDMVAFGVAPASIIYTWILFYSEKMGWVAAFIYVAGAALRLARFNTQIGVADKRYFQGLPSPAAAAVVAGFIWAFHELNPQYRSLQLLALTVTTLVGLLMVSNIRYWSFKKIDPKEKIPFMALLVIVLSVVFVSISPAQILFSLFLIYTLSGPAVTLWNLQKVKSLRRRAPK